MGIDLEPIDSFRSHPTEELLEQYLFEHLPETLIAPLEEHLLLCRRCQDALAETEEFVSTLRIAVETTIPPVAPAPSGWRKVLLTTGLSLGPAMVLATLAFLAVRKPAAVIPTPPAVNLVSVRGMNPLATAPAGTALELHIETPDLRHGQSYSIQVVDGAGAEVWQGAVTDTQGNLIALMPKPLRPGVYWVRLYSVEPAPLREFGLTAK